MRNEVQVILFSISADTENPLDILAINAASAALMISDIPWAGPVAAVRVGRVDGKLIANPTYPELEKSDLDLRIAGTRDAILMVECGSDEVSEDDMVEALSFGHKAIQPLVDAQMQMAAEVGKAKRVVPLYPLEASIVNEVSGKAASLLTKALDTQHTKAELNEAVAKIKTDLVTEAGEDADKVRKIKEAFEEVYKRVVRERILKQGKRPDGRSLTEIRPIWCEVGVSRGHMAPGCSPAARHRF